MLTSWKLFTVVIIQHDCQVSRLPLQYYLLSFIHSFIFLRYAPLNCIFGLPWLNRCLLSRKSFNTLIQKSWETTQNTFNLHCQSLNPILLNRSKKLLQIWKPKCLTLVVFIFRHLTISSVQIDFRHFLKPQPIFSLR